MTTPRWRTVIWTGSFGGPLLVAALFGAFRSSVPASAVALILTAVAAGVAVWAGRGAGIVATVSAAGWFDFFMTRPYDRFSIDHRSDIETFATLLVVGLAVTELAQWGERNRRRHDESSYLVGMVAEGAALANASEDVERVARGASDLLCEILELRSCRYEVENGDPPRARLVANGEVEHAELTWPVSEWGLPGPELEIVANWHSRAVGRFILTPRTGHPVSRSRRIAAVALVATVAAAVAGTPSGT